MSNPGYPPPRACLAMGPSQVGSQVVKFQTLPSWRRVTIHMLTTTQQSSSLTFNSSVNCKSLRKSDSCACFERMLVAHAWAFPVSRQGQGSVHFRGQGKLDISDEILFLPDEFTGTSSGPRGAPAKGQTLCFLLKQNIERILREMLTCS